MEEGADDLRGGVAQDGIQHHLAELANQSLALVLVGLGQNIANHLQGVDHSTLENILEPVSHCCNCGLELSARARFTSVLSLGNRFSRVLTNRMQKLHSAVVCTCASHTKRRIRRVHRPLGCSYPSSSYGGG